jgi:arylsulfatase A-like enzyme
MHLRAHRARTISQVDIVKQGEDDAPTLRLAGRNLAVAPHRDIGSRYHRIGTRALARACQHLREDPIPDRREYRLGAPFPGRIGRTPETSTPAWPVRPTPPVDAPNVVIVLLDDVGFAEIGCFGGLIETPTFDQLAVGGLRYRNFHTTAICVPSRASILTGRNHHAVSMAPPAGSPFPGYHGFMTKDNGMLSEVLRASGYATFALGKWHLTPVAETAAGSTKDSWPLSRGFERYYGFGGAVDQYAPELLYDNHAVEPPATPQDGYHVSADLADRAIEFIADLRAVHRHRPFFMYFCPGAGHSPHHAPRDWADRYKGRFDDGWDAVRTRIFERQLAMGIVPAETKLPPRPAEIPAWSDLTAQQRRVFARQMEVYAGFVSHADHHIGRLVAFLEELGELENTVLVVASDNGASSEGGLEGGNTVLAYGRDKGLAGIEAPPLDEAGLAAWGGPTTNPVYGWGWSWAGNTPMRKWKRFVHEGGISDPLIVHWPRGIRGKGEVREQYTHITDIMPTVLELLRVEPPKRIEGIEQTTLHGVTFAHTFDDPRAPTKKSLQYFECVGSRAIWKDGWKAVIAQERGGPITEETLATERWELYHVAEDFSEHTDLARERPEKLRELIDLWWAEAGRYAVLPISAGSSTPAQIARVRAQSAPSEAPERWVYHRGAPVPHTNAPDVHRRPHRITAEVELPAGAEGVLIMQGDGHFGGYMLYVNGGRLQYVHNWLGMEERRISSSTALPLGLAVLGFRFAPTAEASGTVELLVNDAVVGRGDVPRVSPRLSTVRGDTRRGLSIGYASGRPVSSDVAAPFRFNGRVNRVVVEIGG